MVKERKKSKLFLVVLIAFIMITSVIGFVITFNPNKSSKNLKYNGYEIYKVDKGYAVYVKNNYFYFDNLPQDLENITLNINFNTNKIYLAYDSSEEFNDYPLRKLGSILTSLNYLVYRACIDENSCVEDIPVVNCNQTEKVIYFKVSNKTNLYNMDNCVVLEGSNSDHIKFVDRINYALLGVMK